MKALKIPEAAIIRLSVYSRYLNQLEKNGVTTVSSVDIAEGVNNSPAQVRKDLAYFGEFGTRGVGYNVKELNRHIVKILGLDVEWKVIIAGAGNLGSALTQYRGFQERGFNIMAVFDNDVNKVGLMIGGIPILPTTRLAEFIKRENVQVGIIAVPARHAQEVVDVMVGAGIKAILNFAPRVLSVPSHVEYRSVDLAVNLEVLTFNMVANK
ncbi:MAG: redox-sensing transcriptional repressor Rex [Peptococcaceae bacterium]|nr:redox-sensing transcriptional repressor Rex [Peptococcaceae bacterium]MDH7524232.1 redox-sensing transcriptional repressor Rex [Peptococcaceae bacterium]